MVGWSEEGGVTEVGSLAFSARLERLAWDHVARRILNVFELGTNLGH